MQPHQDGEKIKPPAIRPRERRLLNTISESARADEYVLGPGDGLQIYDSTMGSEEEPYLTETKIAPDGTVSVYPLGVVQAEGLTLREFIRVLNERAGNLPDELSMVAVLSQPRPVTTYVLGDVVNPGHYTNFQPFTEATSQNQPKIQQNTLQVGIGVTYSAAEPPPPASTFTLLGAIQLAGGLRDTADIFHIKLRRFGSKTEEEYNLWRLLVEGDSSQDAVLRAGDTIFIPKGGAPYDVDVLGWAVRRHRPVRIIGQVNRPGLYYLGPADDMMTILSKAGGFTRRAKQRYILLSRLNHDGTVTTRAINTKAMLRNQDKAARATVQPGDIVLVQGSLTRQMLPYIGYIAGVVTAFAAIKTINGMIPNQLIQFNTHPPPGSVQNGGGGSTNFGATGFGAGIGTGALFGLGNSGANSINSQLPPP